MKVTFFVLKYFSQEKYSANLKKWFYSVTADRASGSSFEVSWKISRRTSSFTSKVTSSGPEYYSHEIGENLPFSKSNQHEEKKKERPKIWRFEN